MDNKVKIPIIKEELIKYLNSLFPDKCADLKDSEKKFITNQDKGQSLLI